MDTDNNALLQLLEIMRRLRDPDTGCAWDIKQDFHSIAPYTVEEAYEVAEAIERNDHDDLCDELGDLLFQVVFHAQMAAEIGVFTFSDVAQSIVDKMIRRHPHVFGDVEYKSEADLKAGWETIKAEERRQKRVRRHSGTGLTGDPARHLAINAAGTSSTHEEFTSAVDGVARTLPALKRADKLQKRAARVGFDWPDVQPVWDKLDEEIAEVRAALAEGLTDAIEDELGDLLFTVVNLARHCAVDAEQALQRASGKFEARFRRVEQLASVQPMALSEMTLEQLDVLWEHAKRND